MSASLVGVHPQIHHTETDTDKSHIIFDIAKRYNVRYILVSLFLFYCAIGGNFINSLVGKGMQEVLEKRWMKHLIGFSILLFTISLVTLHSMWSALGFTILLYIWFLLTTKMSMRLNLVVLLVMFIGFFIQELLRKDYTLQWEEDACEDRQVYRKNVRLVLEIFVLVCFIAVICITLVGNISYIKQTWTLHQKSEGKSPLSLFKFMWNYIYAEDAGAVTH